MREPPAPADEVDAKDPGRWRERGGIRSPHRSGLVASIVVGLVGIVFILQGLGAPIGHSFMIGDLRWTVIGLVMLIGATAFAWRAIRG